MTVRPRGRDNDGPVVPPEVGALGLPASPTGKPARRRAARLTRALRTRWWLRFLLLDRSSDVRGLKVHEPCRVTEIVEPNRPQARHER
jgi:hypothetical protein